MDKTVCPMGQPACTPNCKWNINGKCLEEVKVLLMSELIEVLKEIAEKPVRRA